MIIVHLLDKYCTRIKLLTICTGSVSGSTSADAGQTSAARDLAVVLAAAACRGDSARERGACESARGSRDVHSIVREGARGSHSSMADSSRYAPPFTPFMSPPGPYPLLPLDDHLSLQKYNSYCTTIKEWPLFISYQYSN